MLGEQHILELPAILGSTCAAVHALFNAAAAVAADDECGYCLVQDAAVASLVCERTEDLRRRSPLSCLPTDSRTLGSARTG